MQISIHFYDDGEFITSPLYSNRTVVSDLFSACEDVKFTVSGACHSSGDRRLQWPWVADLEWCGASSSSDSGQLHSPFCTLRRVWRQIYRWYSVHLGDKARGLQWSIRDSGYLSKRRVTLSLHASQEVKIMTVFEPITSKKSRYVKRRAYILLLILHL